MKSQWFFGQKSFATGSSTFWILIFEKFKDPVAKPFCPKNHCVKNFKVIGIEKTGNGDKIYRKTKESL